MTVPAGPATEVRRPGRPRDAQADEAILRAATDVLADHGLSGFTVDEVAARAGCGKATIYRRWPSRADLLLDAVRQVTVHIDDPDTGSLREDLVHTFGVLAANLHQPGTQRAIAGMVSEATRNPDMLAALQAFADTRRELGRRVIARGVARGEIPPNVDTEVVLDLLCGPIFFRNLIGAPGTVDLVAAYVDTVLAGVRHDTAPHETQARLPYLTPPSGALEPR